MTTVTVELPFELTREHELLLRAAERRIPCQVVNAHRHRWSDEPYQEARDLSDAGAICYPWDDGWVLFALCPLGRAILKQCPSLWEPDELEAKLQEMAG